jgi:hypothetical protein
MVAMTMPFFRPDVRPWRAIEHRITVLVVFLSEGAGSQLSEPRHGRSGSGSRNLFSVESASRHRLPLAEERYLLSPADEPTTACCSTRVALEHSRNVLVTIDH